MRLRAGEQMIRSILHPTDFSDFSLTAFVHALRIALAAKSRLQVLHVAERPNEDEQTGFPHVRRTLAQWGFIQETDPPEAVAHLGIRIAKIGLDPQSPVAGILGYLDRHASDFLVVATHGRQGFERWLKRSVAETISRRSAIPTLFVSPRARPFVGQVAGEIRLERVLVPVDHAPSPVRALAALEDFGRLLTGRRIAADLVHVGHRAPDLSSATRDQPPVILRSGNVVEAILHAAVEFDVDLICMTTAGHNGVLDALRGSTTERVLRDAPCPVLAVPAVV
jgi:nucleotide-binding universal stress UspA family protein